MSSSKRLLSFAAAAALLATSSISARARADETSTEYTREQTKSEYVAPLAQQTQPSYVPQSVAMSGPAEIKSWRDGDAIPAGYRPVERMRKGLIIGGAVMFGSLYFLSALVAAGNADLNKGETNPAAALYIPAVGPFVQVASSDSSTAKLFLAIDGLGQTAAVTMFIVGLSSPSTVLVRNDLSGNAAPAKPTVHFTPLVGAGTTGASVFGTF